MGNVWAIVLATMVATAVLLYAWHVAVMTAVAGEHRVELAELQANTNELAAYRDAIRAAKDTAANNMN